MNFFLSEKASEREVKMREKAFDSINVVPFIDIMLVLLTIVLATATFIKTGVIPVELPNVSHSESAVEGIVIDLSPQGVFFYQTGEYTIGMLREVLTLASKTTPVTVRADRNAAIQPFAELMSLLNECGFEKVNLQTEVTE
jgi:biopolymer transport protein ExbD